MATVSPIQQQAGEIPTRDELVDRARAMIPTLKSRAKACVANRDAPAETIAEFKEAGFIGSGTGGRCRRGEADAPIHLRIPAGRVDLLSGSFPGEDTQS